MRRSAGGGCAAVSVRGERRPALTKVNEARRRSDRFLLTRDSKKLSFPHGDLGQQNAAGQSLSAERGSGCRGSMLPPHPPHPSYTLIPRCPEGGGSTSILSPRRRFNIVKPAVVGVGDQRSVPEAFRPLTALNRSTVNRRWSRGGSGGGRPRLASLGLSSEQRTSTPSVEQSEHSHTRRH
ncbi:unnamed protein product, partial [Arctogadus glacialis]